MRKKEESNKEKKVNNVLDEMIDILSKYEVKQEINEIIVMFMINIMANIYSQHKLEDARHTLDAIKSEVLNYLVKEGWE